MKQKIDPFKLFEDFDAFAFDSVIQVMQKDNPSRGEIFMLANLKKKYKMLTGRELTLEELEMLKRGE